MLKPSQDIIDEIIDRKNRKFATDSYNLEKEKRRSKFWGGWRGTVNKLPEAMRDTVMGAIRKATNKNKKNK